MWEIQRGTFQKAEGEGIYTWQNFISGTVTTEQQPPYPRGLTRWAFLQITRKDARWLTSEKPKPNKCHDY